MYPNGMHHYLLLLLLPYWSSVKEATGARILALFPHIGRSHFLAFEPYISNLSASGHEVIVYSHFPRENPLPNYTDVSLAGSFTALSDTSAMPPTISLLPFLTFFSPVVFWPAGVYQCYRVLNSKPAQNLIQSDEKFDLVITELFNSDCFLPFVHKFQAPHIAMSSTAPMPVSLSRFGNPENPAYFSNLFLPLTDGMDFFQRLRNSVMYVWVRINVFLLYDLPNELISRLNFGFSIPWLKDIALNTSLLLLNTHPLTHGPRPYVPNIIEVAGLHLPKLGKLPNDIRNFLDEAENGVVYISFGSLLNTEGMSSQKRNACIQAFSQLEQRVLWKWKGQLEQAPTNVMTRGWTPQFDVLNHPNVKVFVTHSGLLGTIEAISSGVPVVTVPFFGDQYNNAKNILRLGMGVELLYSDLTTKNLIHAINEVINNSSYKEHAVMASKIFQDRPHGPLETAIHWTEYVLRHKGTVHMSSAAKDLNFIEYLLLDVVALLLFSCTCILGVTFFCFKKICSSHQKQKTS